VLLAGFSLVILLLLVAAFVGTRNIQSIQQSAATIVSDQQELAGLIDAIQHEQEALSAVFYNLSRGPELVDRAKILTELDTADGNIRDIVSQTDGTPEQSMGDQLERATQEFTAEARRLLGRANSSSLLSRDLFQRHRQVTAAVASLVAAGQAQSRAAQQTITMQSRRLFSQSLVFLSACLVLALIFSLLTVRMATGLFRKMEWQASELSRVSWRMLDNQESAARRFSHELHDELGQALTALRTNLMWISRTSAADKRVADCVELVDGAISNVRELSQLLRPTVLDDFGLDASLRWLAEKFAERTAITVDYQSDFSGRLPDETETHLFRIAQEALTNVARHSGARRVEVRLRVSDSRLGLTISDNGSGLLQPEAAAERGMGMIGMRARARSAGGELAVRSEPGRGVSVEALVPRGSAGS
jgi:signal transduction histidine kinase